MAQTAEGAVKVAAARAGITPEEYVERSNAGLKRCTDCREWKERDADFSVDKSRHDGRTSKCKECARARGKAAYTPTERQRGRRFVEPRDGDKEQARGRVNTMVRLGLIPPPYSLECADCGHVGEDRRHEYDHHLGYSPEHHESVQAVCSACHHRRSIDRGEARSGIQ